MAKITFKAGSTPHTLHLHFASGKSLTCDEAYAMGIRNLTQRIYDLKNKFEEGEATSPIMVFDEKNERGGSHARYFYRGCGCSFENRPGVRIY
jgi:hypothetical protein